MKKYLLLVPLLILIGLLINTCSKDTVKSFTQDAPKIQQPIKITLKQVYQSGGGKVDRVEDGSIKLIVGGKGKVPHMFAGVCYHVVNLTAGHKYNLEFTIKTDKPFCPMFYSLDPKWNEREYINGNQTITKQFQASGDTQDIHLIADGPSTFILKDVKVQ